MVFPVAARAVHPVMNLFCRLLFCLGTFCVLTTSRALATSNHEYGPDEYVTVASGLSPDGRYAVTAHGMGELGYEHFHLFLTDAKAGSRIGPLEEVRNTLDTGAGAFCARWSPDSQQVVLVYRVSRHAPLKAVVYAIGQRRARRLKGPLDVTDPGLVTYWQRQCAEEQPSPKVFGTPVVR